MASTSTGDFGSVLARARRCNAAATRGRTVTARRRSMDASDTHAVDLRGSAQRVCQRAPRAADVRRSIVVRARRRLLHVRRPLPGGQYRLTNTTGVIVAISLGTPALSP